MDGHVCESGHCLNMLSEQYRLVTSLSVEVLPGALQTEQKIGSWREALDNEMNLKGSDAYHRPTGSKYLVGSSSAPYCNSQTDTYWNDFNFPSVA